MNLLSRVKWLFLEVNVFDWNSEKAVEQVVWTFSRLIREVPFATVGRMTKNPCQHLTEETPKNRRFPERRKSIKQGCRRLVLAYCEDETHL